MLELSLFNISTIMSCANKMLNQIDKNTEQGAIIPMHSLLQTQAK